MKMRSSNLNRKTSETDVKLKLKVDGTGSAKITTTIPFFDHLLDSMARHGSFDLTIKATGDNDHHTMEDVSIVLGQAFSEALGDKIGITRFGDSIVPMDDVLVMTSVDIGGRAYCSNGVKFRFKKVEGVHTEMIDHFLETFAHEFKINLHTKLMEGKNEHHKAEALFKSLGISLKEACRITRTDVPSTKGVLER
jgi:imidazoleglycerol-phosphate dehydratase